MDRYSKYLIILILMAFFAISCNKPIIIPDEFVETIPPKPETEEWRELNHSRYEFKVQNVDGVLKIAEAHEKSNCELVINNGKLIGTDRGEWGGYLKFIPNDTSLKPIEARTGNIKFLFQIKDRTYFLDGLAHMGYSGGSLYELTILDTCFSFKQIIDFGDAPEAFTIHKDRLLVATFNNFYIVKDLKQELIFKNTFWTSLYPNSIAVFNDENVFMGIRGGIVKLNLLKRDMKFYKYIK